MKANAIVVRGAALCAAAVLGWGAADVRAGTTAYNIHTLLNQPHPFADNVPNTGSADMPVGESHLRAPARVPAPGASPLPARSAASPTAGDIRPQMVASPGLLRQQSQAGRTRGAGIVSELRIGALAHDVGPFTRNEEEGVDANLEVLFASPDFLRVIWSPRPHLGGNINSSGDTSQVYFGLTWEWNIWRNWFAGFSFGGAVHDGELETDEVDKKELGCRLLFRESVEAGYRFAGRHSVSVYLDHISNAKLCSRNEGLENFGVRYGYRF